MSQKKILHITETFLGGVYTYIKEVSEFCSNKDNLDQYILFNPNRENTNLDGIELDFNKKVKLLKLPMSKNINPYYDVKALIKILVLIYKIKPNIIHLHSSKAGAIGRISSFFYFKKKQVFYSPHGFSFLRMDVSNFKRNVFKFIERFISLVFGGVIIACGETEFQIAKKIGKSILVNNSIGIKETLIKENSENSLIVGTIGRISEQKNPILFNQIAKLLPNHRFIWVGDGLLKEQLNSSNIEVTGWKNNSEALKILENFDIYIQTSLWEGLPYSLLEALLYKKPIIATNIIGNKDIVENGKNGYLFETTNEAIKYIKLLEDDKLRYEFGCNSSRICEEKFNKETNFKRLISIYLSETLFEK